MIRLQFLRYLTAGAIALAVDVSVFAVLRLGTGLDLVLSNLLGRAAGASTAFFINRAWAFHRPPASRSGLAREAWRYGALWLLASIVSSVGIGVTTKALSATPGIIEDLIKLGMEIMVFGMNFIIARLWVFRTVAIAHERAAPGGARRTAD